MICKLRKNVFLPNNFPGIVAFIVISHVTHICCWDEVPSNNNDDNLEDALCTQRHQQQQQQQRQHQLFHQTFPVSLFLHFGWFLFPHLPQEGVQLSAPLMSTSTCLPLTTISTGPWQPLNHTNPCTRECEIVVWWSVRSFVRGISVVIEEFNSEFKSEENLTSEMQTKKSIDVTDV